MRCGVTEEAIDAAWHVFNKNEQLNWRETIRAALTVALPHLAGWREIESAPNHHSTLRTANAARQKEWDTDNQITLAYRGNELAGEVGEACNIIKKLERERMGIVGSRASVEQLAEELADIVICTDLIAMDAGIDLDAAVAKKFNATSEKVGMQTRFILPPAPEVVK